MAVESVGGPLNSQVFDCLLHGRPQRVTVGDTWVSRRVTRKSSESELSYR